MPFENLLDHWGGIWAFNYSQDIQIDTGGAWVRQALYQSLPTVIGSW
jgi:hypothetical protein